MGKSVTRLYSSFKPKHYKLHIHPDKESQTFTGSIVITGQKTGRPSQRLTFHQKELTITDAHITFNDKKGDVEIPVDRINLHKAYDEVRLHTEAMLYPGKYTIRLEFKGKITRPMNGLYPCFFEHEGKQKQLLATQFESHHAREVFPCIDEPEAKATFDLSLTTLEGEEVIANTPIKKQINKGGWLYTDFETTPIMSTYLLAFATGEVAYKESKTKRGVTVRTYATPDNVEMTTFALECAVKTLDFYEDYFGINYPLEKCDMIALPDFASGAMENWGLITYREHTLLVDEEHTTLGTKQYVAMVVAHELAHQWFGNLVTMRWWTDLWLNEGFASWIEYLAVDHMFPEWNMWTQFNVDEQQQAMKLDALEHTHPIEVAINHPDEIRSIFDAISYSKGSSVIHMLHQYLGADNFRDGLRHYLETHKYSNTDTVDLWATLEEISGKPVKSFMHAWTSQSGFPVVHATVDEKSVSLRQERFFLNPKHASLPAVTWPVALLDNSDKAPDQFDTETATFPLSETTDFRLNVGQSGFYRTTYNASHLKHLGEQIKKGHLSPLDRIGILGDMFETAKAGESDTIDALQFLENFRSETEYPVWDIIATAVGSLRTIMNDDELREDIKPYIRELVQAELKRLGWHKSAEDTHFDQLLRPIILGMAAAADEPWVVDHAKKVFAVVQEADDIEGDLSKPITGKALRRGGELDPDLRGVVYGTIARLGDKEEFNQLVSMHNGATNADERLTLVAAITGFKQPELIDRALAMITTEKVRLQDVAYWLAYSFANRYAHKQTWQWLQDNWKWVEENLGTDLSFYRMPLYVARGCSDKTFIKEYQTFFEPKLSPAMDRSYRQGIEMLQWQSAWKDRSLKEVKTFFKAHQEK